MPEAPITPATVIELLTSEHILEPHEPILPETDLAGALAVAERIRGRIASLDIPEPGRGQSHRVSVSVGVVAANCSQVDSSTQLLALADDCLYRAKRAGRNRVVSCVHGLAAAAGPMQ